MYVFPEPGEEAPLTEVSCRSGCWPAYCVPLTERTGQGIGDEPCDPVEASPRFIEMDPMADLEAPVTAGHQYDVAYDTHYSTGNLRQALALYEAILIAHPDAPEAGYATSQIRNIAERVVPSRQLLETQTALARTCIEAAAVA